MKISTVFPEGKVVRKNLKIFLKFCDLFTKERNIGLQFSALSTNEGTREEITKHPLISFSEIGKFGEKFFKLRGRKITLSFTATSDLFCLPEEMLTTLSPLYFAVRVYPYKKNAKLLNPMSNLIRSSLERKFSDLGYTIILNHNEYELGMGYFDEKNKVLEELSF